MWNEIYTENLVWFGERYVVFGYEEEEIIGEIMKEILEEILCEDFRRDCFVGRFTNSDSGICELI